MTKAIENIEEFFISPDRDPIAEFRAHGLLPSETTDRIYTPQDHRRWRFRPVWPPWPNPGPDQPARAVHCRAGTDVGQRAAVVHAGDTAEIGFRWNPGTFFGSLVWFDFRNLGANRNLVAWIELRVNPPGPTTFRLGGSGNPTSILVSNQGTGGQRTIIPLTLKSGSDGRAIAFVTPTEPGAGGAWYSTTLFGF